MSITFSVAGAPASLNFSNGRAATILEIMGAESAPDGELSGEALRTARARLLRLVNSGAAQAHAATPDVVEGRFVACAVTSEYLARRGRELLDLVAYADAHSAPLCWS